MTRQTKARVVGAIFVIFGLYGSALKAEPNVKEKPRSVFTINKLIINIKSANNLASNTAYPGVTSEVFNEYSNISRASFTPMPQQPLTGMQVTDFSLLAPNKFEKKNSIFEFAAKFNDKLQQMLAYFNFSSPNASSQNKQISDKNLDRKIHLITKANKKLTSNCKFRKG